MLIGIFAKTFSRTTLEDTLDAVVAHGLHCVQFNMACAGLPSMPDQIDDVLVNRVRQAMQARQITMAAVSGTFNMIHPDVQKRKDGINRLRVLASKAKPMGTSIITLCTGTRDPQDMWRWHPDNRTPEAWWDLVASMQEALQIADEYDVILGVEPEISNVIETTGKARQLLDEMQSPRLKIVMDAANLFHEGQLPWQRAILDEAFDLLGKDVALAHAKDLKHDGAAGHDAAGTGVLDYDHYLALLRSVGYNRPLILHGLREDQINNSVAFLRRKLNR
ncbi:MAG: sugar phosphate isomerase/epimerase [Anaerolineae bacterium]|nr:sugar phosphate isomerase/epimerase [Anaerolineae bacterium]